MQENSSNSIDREPSIFKKAWLAFKETAKEWGDNDPIHILPYMTYANKNIIHIKGRVLENEGVIKLENSSAWDNLVRNIRYIESDEIPNLKIHVNFNDKVYETFTNDDGYFALEIENSIGNTFENKLLWKTAKISAPTLTNENGKILSTEAKILWPNANSEHIIVSDIDDTILKTEVNSFLKLKLLYNTFFKNAHTRLPFEGIAETLSVLQKNKKGEAVNPVFYLSHSPWNLYPLLVEFIKHHKIPKGPLFLRDLGLKKKAERLAYNEHKRIWLEKLFEDFPDKKFILLGDASEEDANIYLNIFEKYPQRVKAIFIRETKSETKNLAVENLKRDEPKAPLHLIKKSREILEIMKNID